MTQKSGQIERKPPVLNGERPITVDQRKMLYKLVQEIFGRITTAQQTKDQMLEEQYKESIAKDLGIDSINIEIGKLEAQIAALRSKKAKLGFDHQYGSLRLTGKAQLLLENRMAGSPGRVDIQTEQDEVLSKLLLVRTVAEAETLVERARGTR